VIWFVICPSLLNVSATWAGNKLVRLRIVCMVIVFFLFGLCSQVLSALCALFQSIVDRPDRPATPDFRRSGPSSQSWWHAALWSPAICSCSWQHWLAASRSSVRSGWPTFAWMKRRLEERTAPTSSTRSLCSKRMRRTFEDFGRSAAASVSGSGSSAMLCRDNCSPRYVSGFLYYEVYLLCANSTGVTVQTCSATPDLLLVQ